VPKKLKILIRQK